MTQSGLEDDIDAILSASEEELEDRAQKRTPLALGLQGSGAFGAYAWGVADHILEATSYKITAITAAGSGTLTAAALAQGMARDGREGARAAMRELWDDLGSVQGPALRRSPFEFLNPFAWTRAAWQEVITSPYRQGALYHNPLGPLIDKHFDLYTLTGGAGIDLYFGAARVKSGRYQVFSGPEITRDVLLACNATPTLHQAVEVDGEPYWDGAMVYNPALFPLYGHDTPDDILVPVSTPMTRADVPQSAWAIRDRVEEISGAASLSRELRAMEFVNRLIEAGRVSKASYASPRIHLIQDPAIADLSPDIRYFAGTDAIRGLFDIGQRAARDWLKAHPTSIGSEQTANLRDLFL